MGKRVIKEARHVRIYHLMMQTAAWRSLNVYARATYVELSRRYGGTGSNNGRIPYSCRELAENLGVCNATANRALHDLENRGFTKLMKKGRYGKKRTYASEWLLTEFPADIEVEEGKGKAPATHAYRQWEGEARPTANKDFVKRAQNGSTATPKI